MTPLGLLQSLALVLGGAFAVVLLGAVVLERAAGIGKLQLFRAIALVEGVTTIALFLVAMPLKYWADIPLLVPPVGMAHGVAWIGYVVAMAVCLPGKGFSLWEWARTFVAALFPFGTFLNDGLVRRKMALAIPA